MAGTDPASPLIFQRFMGSVPKFLSPNFYPGGELSARMIALRAGVVAAEKMRILREEGNGNREKGSAADDIEATIKRIAAPYGYKAAVRGEIDFAAFRRDVESLVNAVR